MILAVLVYFRLMFVSFPYLDKPHPPQHLAGLSVTAKSIFLQWTDPKSASYIQKTFKINYYSFLNHHLLQKETATVTQFNLTDLLPATLYVIRVVAVNKYFEGDPSNQIIQQTGKAGISKIHSSQNILIFNHSK